MQEHIYTTIEISQLTGFSVRQLDYWAREEMITPGFQQAHGSGSRRLYTVENLIQLNVVKQLKKHHWSTQKIHKVLIDALNTAGQQVMSFVLETLLEELKNSDSISERSIGIDPQELAHTGGNESCH